MADSDFTCLNLEEVIIPWLEWLKRTGRARAPKTRNLYRQYVTELTLQVGKQSLATDVSHTVTGISVFDLGDLKRIL
jgi:hypothetical protein